VFTTKCVMSLHSPTRIKMEYVLQAANSRTGLSFPHASSGIQAEFGLDPRLRHSGVTILGSRISSPQPQFSKAHTTDTKFGKERDVIYSLIFVILVSDRSRGAVRLFRLRQCHAGYFLFSRVFD
jgi:hypothetical protein